MDFRIITLFPEAFKSYLGTSIIDRAIENKKISVKFYNLMDFSEKEGGRIDKKPYGGGPGMVIQAKPVLSAYKKLKEDLDSKYSNKKYKSKVIFFTTDGKEFNQELVEEWKEYDSLIMICGHYEGVDDRVSDIIGTERVYVGKTTLSGGELPALFVLDSVSREIEGVLGNQGSLEGKRNASSKVYTRPEVLEWAGKKYEVPDILYSGNHKEIEDWRSKNSKKYI